MSEYKSRTTCAICDNSHLTDVINFGNVPLAGHFPKNLEELNAERKYNLSLLFCENCGLLQTNSIVDSDFLFRDYRYLSSIGLSKHFSDVSNLYKKKYGLNKDSKVLEIGSNDGVLLEPFDKLHIPAIGFEPSYNVSEIAKKKGCNVINDYFNENNVKKYLDSNTFDLVVANNCFAHIDDIKAIVRGVKLALKDDAFFVIEVHYLRNLIEENQYDFVYHEHLYYYSLISLNSLFTKHGMSIVDFDEIPIHSGSLRVYIQNKENVIIEKVKNRLQLELSSGMGSLAYYKHFAKNVFNHITNLKNDLQQLKQQGASIVGYGASGRANMLFNMCQLTTEVIDFVVDDSPERCDRFIPGVHVPIVSYDVLIETNPDYVVIFAWNYAEMIMKKLEHTSLKFILPFPEFKIIN